MNIRATNIWIIVLSCLFGFTSVCNAATVETTLVFDKNSSLVTPDGASLPMTADFNGTFSLINSISFSFTFAGDLFDPGESISLGPFTKPGGSGYWSSLSNAGNQSLTSVVLYVIDLPIVSLFTDGIQIFDFATRMGSMNILDAKIIADGDFTPSPVPLPPAIWLLGSGLVALWSLRKKPLQ